MATILIFVATYAVIAIGKLPGFHLDRAGAALLGASLMAATGLLSLDDAYRAIDLDTIALLLGMMIVVANLISTKDCTNLSSPGVFLTSSSRVILLCQHISDVAGTIDSSSLA
jgi:di/tricarboxylate transporter